MKVKKPVQLSNYKGKYKITEAKNGTSLKPQASDKSYLSMGFSSPRKILNKRPAFQPKTKTRSLYTKDPISKFTSYKSKKLGNNLHNPLRERKLDLKSNSRIHESSNFASKNPLSNGNTHQGTTLQSPSELIRTTGNVGNSYKTSKKFVSGLAYGSGSKYSRKPKPLTGVGSKLRNRDSNPKNERLFNKIFKKYKVGDRK